MYQHDWAAKWARYQPQKVAVKSYTGGATLTYDELNRLGNRLAHYFLNTLGLKQGERIAVLSETSLEYILLFVAAQKTGLILVPLNYRLANQEIDYLLTNASPALVIAEECFWVNMQACATVRNIPHHWSMETLAAYCDKNTTRPEDAADPAVAIVEDDPIFILYTSGTTGFPKGALYTHKMLFWNSINTSLSLLVNTESRTVNCMPPFHTGGWNVLTTPFLHHGGYSCLLKKFDPATVLKLLEEEQAKVFMGVPTMLKMMADEPDFEKTDFSHLHYIIVGGEPMPIPLIERWQAQGVPIRQGYGMTEVGPNLTSLHQDDAIRKKGSIGRPNFYVTTKIIDELGQEVPPNTGGELLLRGPMVTPGYWENPEATAKAIVDGWFHTGDRVREDEEGYLYVEDRIKNMFISGGENVYPAEIERVLLAHPSVAEAVVIGVPDTKWGEVGCAFVVQQADQAIDTTQLSDYCREHLAKFKVPKFFHFLAELPKNDTGKIDRKYLKGRLS
ncbi:class I adenylate-forming enzyme family protein [Lewinella sp. LCG006]|uniref:class I adenylate-forming enzyme family protein n=1 Tax=Lewinella sp. LCG006 TaxID=3231911 RepID=UPI0034609446